jgi:hypothetical protein
MPITILTEDDAVVDALKNSAPDGVRVSVRYPSPPSGRMTRAAPGIIVTIEFIRDRAINIGEGVFAAWLYDVIKGKAADIFHRGEHVVPEEPPIRRMVQEEFDFLKSDKSDEDDDAS